MIIRWVKETIGKLSGWRFLGSRWDQTGITTTSVALFTTLHAIPVTWATTHPVAVTWQTTHIVPVEWDSTHEISVAWEV